MNFVVVVFHQLLVYRARIDRDRAASFGTIGLTERSDGMLVYRVHREMNVISDDETCVDVRGIV
jgi:hypothetical protein